LCAEVGHVSPVLSALCLSAPPQTPPPPHNPHHTIANYSVDRHRARRESNNTTKQAQAGHFPTEPPAHRECGMRECDELGLALDQNFPSIAFRFLFRPAAERNPPSPSRPRTCISDQLSRPPASRGMYVLGTSTQRLCPPAVDRATDRATDPRIWASSWRDPRFMIRPIIPCHARGADPSRGPYPSERRRVSPRPDTA
jgi:hypothetical protein